MGKLEGTEPKEVFYYFEQISRIPHGSGNTQMLSDYLKKFADDRGLENYQDRLGNIIMIKEASAGYEEHPPVMLQGHMDMVAVKKEDSTIDMEKEGLSLMVQDDWLYADKTSLGADDGIAVAYGLALMAGAYRHPRLELVITVDEEVGMDGARGLDVTPLKSKRMINLDSEEEGIFLAGCAGGARVNLCMHKEPEKRKGLWLKIGIAGLRGGHSGAEIHKERGNAICILGRLLKQISADMEFCLGELKGGVADNAIPIFAEAGFLLTDCETEKAYQRLERFCRETEQMLREEFKDKEPDITVKIEKGSEEERAVLDKEASGRLVLLLNSIPWGVQAMSVSMPGLVETSLNPGLLQMKEGKFQLGISVRSSLDPAKDALIERLKSIGELAGAEAFVTGEYPGWAYRKDSPLREGMVEVYRDLYGREPVTEAIHAGVECGILAHKLPGLDCVSIGPDMRDIHTTEEKLSVSSAGRMWKYLLRVLETL